MNTSTVMPVDLDRVKEIVADLREPKPIIYYADLLSSALLGWALLAMSIFTSHLGIRVLAFAGASFALFRALAFIHELFHQQAMKGFRWVWHAVVGVPLLVPFLLYLPIHQGHHNSKIYGTKEDGEYEQFLGRCMAKSIELVAVGMLLPLALIIRFGVLTPISALFPVVRQKVIPNFVHMSLRLPFRAPLIKESARAEALVVEWCCALLVWGLLAYSYLVSVDALLWWAALVVSIGTLNLLRALFTTHLYVELEQGRDARGQLLDSMNIDNAGLLTQLMCPTGLRFHALHHVAPYLPYHALRTAHDRLMAQLPVDSEYHQIGMKSLGDGFRRVVEATSMGGHRS
jgi:fatty acid desaturase